MQVEILNLYSNEALPNSNLKGDHGESFLIRTPQHQILFDIGNKGKLLLHNMKELGIHPNEITHLIFSHAHYDHTAALPMFLDNRTSEEILPIYAHPAIMDPKRLKIGFIHLNISFPKLTKTQQKKVEYHFSPDPIDITPFLHTTGEIKDRLYKDGVEKKCLVQEKDKYRIDPVKEDLSLTLNTIDGNVIITGCAHAGILNIVKHVKLQFKQKILAIIGGSHMVRYSEAEVIETSNELKTNYDFPLLYLNHCTDKLPLKIMKQTPAIKILAETYDSDKVKRCYVGTNLEFATNN
jgi:7,8-dihydropterin-6-yl-methyl-4-(beta-D-ribofuranosyl)aminobenzene 5'-phosphate synthase